jgi:transcriptional regulator with XRE-family HTH domain
MNIQTKVGERIRELRGELNLSQRDLAYKADLDRSYIAGIEKGLRNVSIVNIEKIILALNLTVQDFFTNDKFNR